MEDVLMILLQAAGEFLLELVSWIPWDWLWYWGPLDASPSSEPWSREGTFVVRAISSLVVGALLGWGSLYVFPAVLVRWSWLRIVLLFLSPLASGVMGYQLARSREARKGESDSWLHFTTALCFSIGFVWVRFALAHRPA